MKRSKTGTKIIATAGPACASPLVLKKLVSGGVNILRLNFAHGDLSSHQSFIHHARKEAKQVGRPVGILQDLPGPKLRVSLLGQSSMELSVGQEVILTSRQKKTFGQRIQIPYPRLSKDLRVGHSVFIADGMIRLQVVGRKRHDVFCRVTHGGTVRSGNGVNMPLSSLTLNAFTKKDETYLKWGIKNKVDFVGISFVGTSNDIVRVRKFCAKKKHKPFIIAKVERQQAIKNLDTILDVADGIMVARGDLGVEISFSEIPGLQKDIVKMAKKKGKPVIVATQVLESMIQNPRPTRAEATDIANSIQEGADAIMLSGETSIGQFPVESVRALHDVIRSSEERGWDSNINSHDLEVSLSDIIAHEACHMAERISASLLVVPTVTGATAERVSRFRPSMQVLALSDNQTLRRRFSLFWGIQTLPIPRKWNYGNTFSFVRTHLLRKRLVNRGDKVLVVSGAPGLKKSQTGMVQVVEI